jgi:hypothetical protein
MVYIKIAALPQMTDGSALARLFRRPLHKVVVAGLQGVMHRRRTCRATTKTGLFFMGK